jgi:hypothetical protein
MTLHRTKLFGLCLALGLVACGSPAPRVASPPRSGLPALFASAFRVDAEGDGDRSVGAYLSVVRDAAHHSEDPWTVAAIAATLDALVTRTMPSLGEFADDAALAQRAKMPVAEPLEQIHRETKGPLVPAMIARALTRYHERRGDAVRAEIWRTASGCAREALVIGPISTRPATGLDAPDPLDRYDAPVPPAVPTDSAFLAPGVPTAVRNRGCSIPLSVADAQPGIREVVVDVVVPKDETIGIALRSRGAALLRAGGVIALRRPFNVVSGDRTDYILVTAPAGVLRLVARIGSEHDDDALEIDASDEDGTPLRTRIPQTGASATSHARTTRLVDVPEPTSLPERLLGSAAAVALGRHGDAEQLARPVATRPDAPPDLALIYGRAVDMADDLSPAVRAQRGRAAYDRVREVWPTSWEAAIAHAVLAGRRRSPEESGFETLRDVSADRPGAARPSSAIADAFDALTSARRHMLDRARASLDRARSALDGTALFADAASALGAQVGSDHTSNLCDTSRKVSHDTLSCFEALKASGRHRDALDELQRVRNIDGAPSRYLPFELREHLSMATPAATEQARRAFDSMLSAERSITVYAMLGAAGAAERAMLRAWASPRDATDAIGPLLRAVGEDPTSQFDGIAEKLAAASDPTPETTGVATTVLTHVERYALQETGLLSWVLFDVRRVSGTTDVEEHANAPAPDIWGRSATRALRRRILKRDGRILEPDPTPRASQAHADLSELEPGDIVEAIDEGWAGPTDVGGDLEIDTPDLLPERTAVRDASIEIRVPRQFRAAHWSHALLGQPIERLEGRVQSLTWNVHAQGERRIEDSTPRMDRAVRVTFSTTRWTDVANTLVETMTAMDDQSPEVASWVRQATGTCEAGASTTSACSKPSLASEQRAAIDALVHATGEVIHESDPMFLSDFTLGATTTASRTARSFLGAHEGSRSWLVLRGLRELGIASDLVVGEDEPFSADPSFPPHRGRFSHPLVVAHIGDKDVWIDADVRGPPLPAGRLSPALRGRLGLHMDGSIAPVPSVSDGSEQDEIDIRLDLDDHRDARGTFTAILRGREAQTTAEALARIVGAERQRALRNIVLAWLPWADVDQVELSSGEESWQIGLRARVTIPGYAMAVPTEARQTSRPLRGGNTWEVPGLDPLHWSSPRARVSTLAATFAARAGRRSALAIDTTVQYHVHRRVGLPHGAAVSDLPRPFTLMGGLIEASRTVQVSRDGNGNGNAIEDDFVLGVRSGTVSAAAYGSFVGDTHSADDVFLAGTRIAVP